jgi:hypothetical protein
MNPKPNFKLFSLKGKEQAVVHQGVSTLIISLVTLSLVALTACMQVVQAGEPVAAVAPPQVEASGQSSIEILPTIDPADRKFFNSGYGVNAPKNDLTAYHQSEWNRTSNIDLSIEDFPTIDPADRKFFNPGYGTQTTSAKQSEAILPTIENEFGEQTPIWFLLK